MKKYIVAFIGIFAAVILILTLALTLIIGSVSNNKSDSASGHESTETQKQNDQSEAEDNSNDDTRGDMQEDIDPSESFPEQPTSAQVYDNGIATMTYDGTKLFFSETPSDDESAYPLTTFLSVENEDVLPRLDIIPIDVTSSTPILTEDNFSQLVKTMLLGYYTINEQGGVNIALDTPMITEGANGVLYVGSIGFSTSKEGSFTPDMNGTARIQIFGTRALVTLELAKKGMEVPKEFTDVAVSAKMY